jgi:hypothetical protein
MLPGLLLLGFQPKIDILNGSVVFSGLLFVLQEMY